MFTQGQDGRTPLESGESGSGKARADAAALVLGALLGTSAGAAACAHLAPTPTHGVVSEVVFAGAPDAARATFVVGAALVLGALGALALRRRLARRLGAGAIAPFLPGVLAPAVACGALPAWSLFGAGAFFGVAALALAGRDLDLALVAFALGAGEGVALVAGRVASPGAVLVILAAAGAVGCLAAARLGRLLERGDGADEGLARALLGLAPLGLGALAPWALGPTYEGAAWPDERRFLLAGALAALAPILAAACSARALRAPAEPGARALLRWRFLHVILPLAAAGLTVATLPSGLDLVHMGERAHVASAVARGAVPFRDIFSIKPINDIAVPLAGFSLWGENVGAIARADALLTPLAAGVEALLAVTILPARLAGVVTLLRLAAPLRVLYGPYAGSPTAPHRYVLRDLAIVALAWALGAEKPRARTVGAALAVAFVASLGGLDAAVALALAAAVAALLRLAATGREALGPLARGASVPLVLAATLLAALAASGALRSCIEFHAHCIAATPNNYATPYEAAAGDDPLAVPLRALRLHGPAVAALAAAALVLARLLRGSFDRRSAGAALVATVLLFGTPVAMARTVSAHHDAATHLVPALLAFVLWRAAPALSLVSEEGVRAAAPVLGLGLLLLGCGAPESLERLAAGGVTHVGAARPLAAPRGRGGAVDPSSAEAADLLLEKVARRPAGSMLTLQEAPLLDFLAERPSLSPFALTVLGNTLWERRIVLARLRDHPPAVVVLLPCAAGRLPDELPYPEVTTQLWASFGPTEVVGPYAILERREPGPLVVAPRVLEIAGQAHDLGHVPETWGRERLGAEVGAGVSLATFPGAVVAGPLAGWRSEPGGPALAARGPGFTPATVAFVRARVGGSGRAVVAFETERVAGIVREQSFGFAVSEGASEVLVPVGAFASWHWSGRIGAVSVLPDGPGVRIETVELLAPFD